MAENLSVTTERVDDIPILLAQGKKIGVPELVDQHFEAHGNWQGTSMGWTILIWLTHILSKGDHRLNQVAQWAENRLHTLEISTDQRIRAQESGAMTDWGSCWIGWLIPRSGRRLKATSTGARFGSIT